MENKLDISKTCSNLDKVLNINNLSPKQNDISELSRKVLKNCINMKKQLDEVSKELHLYTPQKGGKKVRKHRGIIQTGGNKGRLRKGYRYSGKTLKGGLPQIIKCKQKGGNPACQPTPCPPPSPIPEPDCLQPPCTPPIQVDCSQNCPEPIEK